MSEDYTPFDVDVTTEDRGREAINRSSPDDQVYGSRVAIGGDNPIRRTCG